MLNIGDEKKSKIMNIKFKYLLFATIILFFALILCQYLKFSYKVGEYKISSSFWTLGPRYYIEINSSSGAKVLFKGGYLELIEKPDNTHYFDDFILPRNGADTIYIFRPDAVIKNDGFVVETVIPPRWIQDKDDSKLYHIDLGTHYGRLFNKKDNNYEVLDSAFYRITTSGDALYIHTDIINMNIVQPYDFQNKLLGIIPMPVKRFIKQQQ